MRRKSVAVFEYLAIVYKVDSFMGGTKKSKEAIIETSLLEEAAIEEDRQVTFGE